MNCKFYYFVIFIFLSVFLLSIAQPDNYWEGKVRIINLGPPINLDDIDYAPYISQDGINLLFITKREGNYLDPETKILSYDIWLGFKSNPTDTFFKSVFNLSTHTYSSINTGTYEGPACLSSEKKMIYFSRYYKTNISRSYYLLFSEIQIWDNEFIEGSPILFDEKINGGYGGLSPSISPDNLKLYFEKFSSGTRTSMYSSSIYNSDIFCSEYDTVNQKWKKAYPLLSVNTPETEIAPYICPDNKTLVFVAKDRRDGLGGFDFYYSSLASNGDWSEPKNLGKPFNSSADDYYISFNGTGDIAYFSSNRDNKSDTENKVKIYMAYLSEPFFKEVRTISWQQLADVNVVIDIFDSTGNQVNSINRGLQKAGRHSFDWDGLDSEGKPLTSGVYNFMVTIGDYMPEPPRFLRLK